MFDHLRLETLAGLGAASLLAYVLWGPKTSKTRTANAAGALAGLQNVGSSCFLNAVLQALASSAAVVRWLSSPPSAGASSGHRQLRTALIDVIQVVNRTHPELRADPFTPAGVIACLSRLGWLIRSEEQDTHEMFYVLMSTLQEEPPPPPALSADGLQEGDGPVEGDTGEPLVDWGGLSARMRGDARDICDVGDGVAGGSTVGVDKDGDTGETMRAEVLTESRPKDAVNDCEEVSDDSQVLKQNGDLVCEGGSPAPGRENGDTAAVRAYDNILVASYIDEGGDQAKDCGAGGDTASEQPDSSCNGTSSSANTNGQSETISLSNGIGIEDVLESRLLPSAPTSSCPAAAAAESIAILTPPESPKFTAAAAGTPSTRPALASAGPGSVAAVSQRAAGAPTGRPGPGLTVSAPAAGVGRCSPLVAGAAGRRRQRGIVHRVPSAAAGRPSWRGAAGQLRSPFTGTVSTQLVCQSCGHKCAVRWENFESLSLPLPAAPRPQALSLPSLLGQFSARETVHDVTCDGCRRRGRFSKRTLVAKLPAALCLHLPRTTWQDNGQAGKRGDHVSFFETLNMFPYTYAANATAAAAGRPVSPPVDSGRHTYRLTAVIVHSGGASSGHFVTYRRLPDATDNRWFYTSDTLVSRASASEVFASAAYMLFYDRVTLASLPAAPITASPVAAALLSPVSPALLSPRSPVSQLFPAAPSGH